jgi:hypothetical membrane protein
MNAIATTTGQQARPFSLQPLCLRTHRIANAIVLLLVPVQFYAAGFGIFGAGTMQPHALIGWAMIPIALVSAFSAAVARRGRGDVSRALGVLGLIILQPILAFAPRASVPELSALHPVTGLAIGVLAFMIHQRLRRVSR